MAIEPTHDGAMIHGYQNNAYREDPVAAERDTRSSSAVALPEVAVHETTPLNSRATVWSWIRPKLWAVPLIYTQFWFSGVCSLMAPYFPGLAAKRDLNAWQYGFFFSTWKIGLLIGSILSERLTAYVSPKAGYLTGQVGLFIFTIAFGSFFWIQDGSTLLGLSITSAVYGGTVASMYTVSLYSMITSRFQDDAGLLIASMECLWGIGSMAGAVTGGALIDLWAYPLPFYVMGTLVLISFPFMYKMNPREERAAVQLLDEPPLQQPEVKYYRLLWDLPFLSDMVTVTLAWGILSFNEPTLEPFLQQFKLSSTQIGAVFTVQSTCYAASAILAGVLSKYKYEQVAIFLTTGLGCLAYLLIGPAPFIDMEPDLALIYLSQVLMGITMSGQFVCGYMHSLRSIISRGYPDNVRTSSLVSSAVFFCMIIGAVATSPLAGYLAETFGYRNASLLMFVVLLLWTFVTGCQWLNSLCSPAAAATRL